MVINLNKDNMAFTEQQLIQLRATQLKHHEQNMIEILTFGEDHYIKTYIEVLKQDMKEKVNIEMSWEIQTILYNTAKACIDHLFKTLSYD